MHVLVRPRHTHRPPLHSIAPQHSELARQGAPPPVQQRSVPRSTAQWSPAQQLCSLVHTVVLAGGRQVAFGGRHVPAVQTSPGQQSLPSQGISLP